MHAVRSKNRERENLIDSLLSGELSIEDKQTLGMAAPLAPTVSGEARPDESERRRASAQLMKKVLSAYRGSKFTAEENVLVEALLD
jgi:hypothetical protein